jgi:integrase
VRERTYHDYEDVNRRYIKSALGQKRLSDITSLDIQGVYSDMLSKGLAARTVRYTHAVISSALKQAVKWGILDRNAANFVDLPRLTKREMAAMSSEEAGRFLESADKDRWAVMWRLALFTGMRPEEYLGLQWKDIDFERAVVRVQRALIWRRRGGGWRIEEPKTAKSRRSINIPLDLAKKLKEHKRHQAEERMKAGAKYQSLDLVFATPKGGPLMSQNLFRRHFKPILKEAGLPQSLTMYTLRHSCATLLLEAEENPKVVSERLGHSTITLTLDTYSHVLPSMQREATRKLENLLSRKPQERAN